MHLDHKTKETKLKKKKKKKKTTAKNPIICIYYPGPVDEKREQLWGKPGRVETLSWPVIVLFK